MGDLSRSLVWLALGLSVLVPLLGWCLGGQSPQQMFLTGLSLAFATIPEEMPIIIIIIIMVLALGAYRLSRQRAIVKDLQVVETLGAMAVIVTDKTGTLTENRMAVKQVWPEALGHQILEIGVLCNDAAEDGDQVRGDPLDTALLRVAREVGLDSKALSSNYECSLLMQDPGLVARLQSRFAVDILESHAVTPDSLNAQSWQQRLLAYSCSLISGWL